MRLRSPSPEHTAALASALAEAVDARGLVIGLSGPLGSGKTVFAKGLAEGLGIDPGRVASPTFTIASEYVCAGGRRLVHVDCYRVASAAELEAAGLLDWLAPGALVVVEWSDRFPEALPGDRLELRLERPDPQRSPSARELDAVASGASASATLARWREALARRGTDAWD